MHKSISLVAALGVVAGLSWAAPSPSKAEEPSVEVVFDEPAPTDSKKQNDEECTTSCSLKKHPIPEFGYNDYRQALAAYAKRPVHEGGQALDQLLFHGLHTEELVDIYGTAELPDEHKAYLRQQLSRRNAIVSLRMVGADGEVVVSYGPMPVPLGQKQHLAPVGDELQAMEFNGTVMRTGVNYLWSRY